MPESTLLATQGIFNLPYHMGMVSEELTFDDAVKLYTAGKWISSQLNVMAVRGLVLVSPRSPTQHLNQLSSTHSAILSGLMKEHV